jgi:hypothetical protein
MKDSSGLASITVDDLLVSPAPAGRRGLSRGLDAATDPGQAAGEGSCNPVTALFARQGRSTWTRRGAE